VNRWRLAVAGVLLLVVAVPLAMPFLALLDHPHAWSAWRESERLASLAQNTLLLVGGTLALALPLGVAGAVLLYRTDLPGRHLLRSVTILALFVPLPLFATAWQATLGTGGWLPVTFWTTLPPDDPDIAATGIAWKPWTQGLLPAIWIHVVAALPWVIWIVGQGLCWVERELEEEALLAAGAWHVLNH
jgi:iron(III) transport system permease protein